jgi:DNA polymerase III delta subunit
MLAEIEQRLATAPLFGGGTLVVVRQPGALLQGRETRERLLRLVAVVPAGNGLALAELRSSGRRSDRGSDPLSAAVAAIGGVVELFPAPTRERMEAWIDGRARELGVRLGPGAAAALAERVGAHVREGDVDRRRQTQLANAELEKLALYRPGGTVTREDVAALVADAIPASTWAFLDAVGQRRTREATRLAERLLGEGTAIPLVVTQLHRRIRELLLVREHLATGATPQRLARVMGLQPYRARKLAEQAAAWTLAELEAALDGLLDLDLMSKGIRPDGNPGPISDERSALGLDVWMAERVARQAAGEGASR